jgi:hypothetical protein
MAREAASVYVRFMAGVLPEDQPPPASRIIGKARARGQHPGIPVEWTAVLDLNPGVLRPDALPGYVWLQLPDRICQVHRQCLEFWYDPPGCALTDEELDLLRRIAAANAPVMFQAEGRTVPAHLAFDHRVDVLRDLRKAGWIVLEVWIAEPGNRGYARRRYSAAQAHCTVSGREVLEVIGGE